MNSILRTKNEKIINKLPTLRQRINEMLSDEKKLETLLLRCANEKEKVSFVNFLQKIVSLPQEETPCDRMIVYFKQYELDDKGHICECIRSYLYLPNNKDVSYLNELEGYCALKKYTISTLVDVVLLPFQINPNLNRYDVLYSLLDEMSCHDCKEKVEKDIFDNVLKESLYYENQLKCDLQNKYEYIITYRRYARAVQYLIN